MKIDIGQLEFIDQTLRTILVETEELLGEEQIVTSIYRPGDAGVHGTIPVRGVDWRCRDKEKGDKIASMINSMWQYDPGRADKKCCICHDVGLGLHLHIQSHPRTVRV